MGLKLFRNKNKHWIKGRPPIHGWLRNFFAIKRRKAPSPVNPAMDQAVNYLRDQLLQLEPGEMLLNYLRWRGEGKQLLSIRLHQNSDGRWTIELIYQFNPVYDGSVRSLIVDGTVIDLRDYAKWQYINK